jgi:hypothetical protein
MGGAKTLGNTPLSQHLELEYSEREREGKLLWNSMKKICSRP